MAKSLETMAFVFLLLIGYALSQIVDEVERIRKAVERR